MFGQFRIPLFDLVMSLSGAMDLVSKELVNHHKQVAYIALRVASEMDISIHEQRNIGLAGMLHDIGALSIEERLGSLTFESENPQSHANTGHLLLSEIDPLARTNIADLVKYHHVRWLDKEEKTSNGEVVPFSCHILHLADSVAVLLDKKKYILEQVDEIIGVVDSHAGEMFSPEIVSAFKKLAKEEFFWFDTVSPSIGGILQRRLSLNALNLDLNGLLGLADVFRRIIDFRSSFTATHSSGVAASAESLASLYGFSEQEQLMMRIAGYFHDMGKLAVQVEILEKPGRLTSQEFNIIKSHSYFTHRILEPLEALSQITEWAAFHHERLSGDGYPFHLDNRGLSLGARIMAVADVFSAITEDRPYREGMSSEKALGILQNMVDSGALDGEVVARLKRNFDDVTHARISAQQLSNNEYEKFRLLSLPPDSAWTA